MNKLANIEGDEVVIRVPITALPDAAAVAWDRYFGRHSFYVTDLQHFAAAFVARLNKENEIGETLVHDCLDRAAYEVVEHDCGEAGVAER